MSFKRISLLILLILSLVAVAIRLIGPTAPPPAEKPPATALHKPAPEHKHPTPAPLPPTTMPMQPAPPPPVEEEDEESEEQQMAAARQLLGSSNPEQRMEGAEQLGAYPNRESEALLGQTLASDPEADVRNAAAQSLGYVEKPTDATLAALMAALEDMNEDVRASALSTLEDYMAANDEGSKRYRKIQAGLQQKAAARSTPQDVRDAIRDILEEQTESGQ